MKIENLNRSNLIKLVKEYDGYVNNICNDDQNIMNKVPVCVEEYLNNDYEMIEEVEDEVQDIFTNTSAEIVDIFEDMLDEFDISLPGDDREGFREEARIYGEIYYSVESKVEDLLQEFLDKLEK